MNAISINYSKFLRGLTLLSFALFLVRLFISGQINMLVSPVIGSIVKVSLILLFVVTISSLNQSFVWRLLNHNHHHHDNCDSGHNHTPPNSFWARTTIALFIFVIAVAFSWRPKALGTDMIAQAAANSSSSVPSTASSSDPSISSENGASANVNSTPPASGGVMDQPNGTDSQASIAMRFQSDPNQYWNKLVTMDGFVYHPAGLPANYFVLTRYFIFCCIADAAPFGITVKSDDAQNFKNDTWVNVTGMIQQVELPILSQIQPTAWYPPNYMPKQMPAIQANTIKTIPTPANPYMFPK